MKILAIDTSCDETAVAVSVNNILLSNTLSSSMEFQNEWGGVVPVIARKNHVNRIDRVIKRALKMAGLALKDIDVFAVTYGPGLAIALEVGIAKAKELAIKYHKKLVAVNHMAGHVYANFAKKTNGTFYSGIKTDNAFPLIALLISGGHTELVFMKEHMGFEVIGKTLDDSIGEAFDKVARMLRWGYPGGPIVERFAKLGNPDTFKFPIAMANSPDLNFSYSGLKTAVLREVTAHGNLVENRDRQIIDPKQYENEPYTPSRSKKPVFKLSKTDSINIAASFQKAATQQLIIKAIKAVNQYKVSKLLLGGGVVNNLYIRSRLRQALKKEGVTLFYPRHKRLLTDNAGMIASAAYYMTCQNIYSIPSNVDRKPNLEL